MNEPRDIRLKRLFMRSMRRGIKEMDLILDAYARAHLSKMTDAELDIYEALLNENDQDLYQWVSAQTDAPDYLKALVEDIAAGATGVVRT